MRPSQVTSSGTDAPPAQKVSYLDKIDDEDVLHALENLRWKKTLRKSGVVGTPPRPPPRPPSPSVSPPQTSMNMQDRQRHHHQQQQQSQQSQVEETSSTRSVTITHQVRTDKNKNKGKGKGKNATKNTIAQLGTTTKSMRNRKIRKTPSSSNDSHQTASTKSISSILSSDHEEENEKMDIFLFGSGSGNDGHNGSTQYYYQVDDDDDLVEENMAQAPRQLGGKTNDDATTSKTQSSHGNGGLWDKWENIGTSFLQRFSCQPVMTKMVSSCEPLDRNAKKNVQGTTLPSSSSTSPPSTIIGPFRISQQSRDRLVQQKEELVQNLKIRFDQMLVNSGTGDDGLVDDGADDDDDVDTVLEDAAMAAATASAFDDNATATSLYLAHKELREAIAEARRTRGPLTSEKRIEVLTLRLRVMSKKVMDKVDDFLFGMDDDEDDEDTAAVREFLNEDDRTYLTASVADQSFDDEEETLGTYLTTETKTKVPNGAQATTKDECITPPRRGGKGNAKNLTTTVTSKTETAAPHQPPHLVRKSSVTATAELFDPSQAVVVEEGIRCDNNVPEDELLVDAHCNASASFEVSSLDGGR